MDPELKIILHAISGTHFKKKQEMQIVFNKAPPEIRAPVWRAGDI